MEPVRLGVLGCGRIARKVVPAMQASGKIVVATVASQRAGVAAEFAREFQIARACDSYAELLAETGVEAVYIPATGEQHHPLTLAAAAAGKHVLCEKPLATSVAEAVEMVAACREAGVLLQEAFMWRHHPRAGTTRERLLAGSIGDLRLINVSFSFPLRANDWRRDPARGGGVMWDLGCYGVDAARYFTGQEPADVYARAHCGERGVDLSMQLALTFPGGVLTNIDCSFEVPWRCRLELVGTTGRFEWPCAFQHWDPVIHVYQGTDWNAPPEVIRCPEVNPYAAQAIAFADSIRAGRLLAPAENGLANMRVLEAALQVARSGRRGEV